MYEYRWIQPDPGYDIADTIVAYSNWLTDNIGGRIWTGMKYQHWQTLHAELNHWCSIIPDLQDIATAKANAASTSLTYEGESWCLYGLLWISKRDSHKATFLLRADDEATLLHFKLACL